MLLISSEDFFQNKHLKKNLLGTLSECQTVMFGWSIVYFEGSLVYFEGSQTELSKLCCISVDEDRFHLNK